MRIIFRTIVIAVVLLGSSCGKDTANTIADILDEEVEQLEDTVLDVETVSDNVLIEGGTKMSGTPPTPNGAISLDISDSGKTAFLGEGFKVSMTSDTDLIGVYIQFKSKDGGISDSYYDVNLETNNSDVSDKSSRRRRVAKINTSSLMNKTDETVLDVDFNANIEPGEFCYVLCVYDNAGNISDPQEVCLSVESWGGSNALVGFWKLEKDDYTQDGMTVTVNLGEEICSDAGEWQCDGGGTFERSNCSTTEVLEMNINSDGTYDYELRSSQRYVDVTASEANCDPVYKTTNFYYTSSGKWAYIADENRLAMLEYEYDEDGYEGTNETGEAYALYDDEIEINGRSLILSYDISYEENGVIDRIENEYFQKQ